MNFRTSHLLYLAAHLASSVVPDMPRLHDLTDNTKGYKNIPHKKGWKHNRKKKKKR